MNTLPTPRLASLLRTQAEGTYTTEAAIDRKELTDGEGQLEVAVGDRVDAGQVLGFVGSSGHSSGPHLHFEVHFGDKANRRNAIDPVPFMRFVGAPL